jgi:hypothetical protein
MMPLHELVPLLQLAIGPVIVISGIALILLTMTNRYGRIIDRSRALADLIREVPGDDTRRLQSQLDIMVRRARLLRSAIALASLSLLLAAFLVISLFLITLFGVEAAPVIIVLFISCMLFLIASLIVFIVDVNVSLSALKLEIDRSYKENAE